MSKQFFIVFFISSFFLAANGQDTTKVTIHTANQYRDKLVTFCDLVAEIYRPTGENKMIYINFGGKYPDQLFTAVIYPADQLRFPYNLLALLKNKTICINGKITDYKGKSQMVLTEPEQIQIREQTGVYHWPGCVYDRVFSIFDLKKIDWCINNFICQCMDFEYYVDALI